MSNSSIDPTPDSKAPCEKPVMGGLTPNTLTSMTLSISLSMATRMLEASRAFNASLKRFDEKDRKNQWKSAAQQSGNTLLNGLLRDSAGWSDDQIRLSLLLFLDRDKSSKLESAFTMLSGKNSDPSHFSSSGVASNLNLTRDQVQMLFHSLLFAISTCIQYPEDTAHIQEWKLPETTKCSIMEIANYATLKVMDFCQRRFHHYPPPATAPNGNLMPPPPPVQKVSFHHFGEWYNSGGFSLVPWLELLDLGKWDHAGRSAVKQYGSEYVGTTAATASYQQGYHATTTTMNTHPHHPQPLNGRPYYPQPHIPKASAPQTTHPIHPFNHHPPNPNLINSHRPSIPTSSHDSTSSVPANEAPMPISNSKEILLHIELVKQQFIKITHENISIVDHIYHNFGFHSKTPKDILRILMDFVRSSSSQMASNHLVSKMKFVSFFNALKPISYSSTLKGGNAELIMSLIYHVFTMNHSPGEEADAVELAIGMSLFCSGSKSNKLGETFDMLANQAGMGMTQHQLIRYLSSYLKMFACVSLLTCSTESLRLHLSALSAKGSPQNQFILKLIEGTDKAARYIVDVLLCRNNSKRRTDLVSLPDFAAWYSNGGHSVASWIEYLDMNKLFALAPKVVVAQIPVKSHVNLTPLPPLNPPNSNGKIRSFDDFMAETPSPNLRDLQTPRSAHLSQRATPASTVHIPPDPLDVMFTFPLVKTRSLIVLREDAAYVRAVVDQLGLLLSEPDAVWSKLFTHVKKNPPKPLPGELAKLHKSGTGKRSDIDRTEFINGVLKSVPVKLRKKESDPPLPPTAEETLGNFFLSFDLDQVNRVAINQLMGGLTLFCGGRKSQKLSFAFSLFDMRSEEQKNSKKRKLDDVTSLSGKELYFFFRSLLIVMFSCCKQSLDLTAETVSRYIADTANMVTDDVMKFQKATRKMDRINFDEFGEWYNEGGFEIAPWLELLDLNKWVLLDKAKVEKLLAESKPMEAKRKCHLKDSTNRQSFPAPLPTPHKNHSGSETFDHIPTTPADHAFDPSTYEFFGDDIDMDAIDDFGFDFNDGVTTAMQVNDFPPPVLAPNYLIPSREQKPLNFKVAANESTIYNVSIPSYRVQLIESIINDHQIFRLTTESVCRSILAEKTGKLISKDRYMDVVKKVFKPNSSSTNGKLLLQLLLSLFHEFDFNKCGKADAIELACGLTVLCGGRKSDKIEYAFEFLDPNNNGRVTRYSLVRYLRAFLTVLLQINSCEMSENVVDNAIFDAIGQPVDKSLSIERITGAVSSWAAEQVFKCTPKEKLLVQNGDDSINFDNFAEWYTSGGYNDADWLELLDLKKWINLSM